MPLPSDERIVQLANDVLATFDQIFGVHAGFRAAHAKGIMLSGTFTPAKEAAALTSAPHITRASTPVTVRFSNSTGFPGIADNDANSNPRGMAIRFHLAERVHTDIVSHSADGFPTRTGQEFLEFLRARVSGDPSKFLAAHPETVAFIQMPKPSPASFAKENYFGVTAFQFTNAEGVARFGRYRMVPAGAVEHLSEEAAKQAGETYLFDELSKRIESGPIEFDIHVQVANAGDTVDNATIHWPEDRQKVNLGTLSLTSKAPDDETHQRIIFDPIPRVEGIEPSADPLLELRAAIYLLSGRRRREAVHAK